MPGCLRDRSAALLHDLHQICAPTVRQLANSKPRAYGAGTYRARVWWCEDVMQLAS